MARSQPRGKRGGYWRIWVFMLLSFLSIASAVFVVCSVFGMLIFALLGEEHYILGGISLIAAIVILAQILVPLSYRFLARAFPLKASGEPDSTSLRFLRRAFATMLAVCLGLAAWGLSLIWDLVFPSSIFDVLAWIVLMLCSALLLFSASVTWSLITLIRFHKHPAAWASKGFILFLRSFGSVSDSSALGFLVTGAGPWRVALLSSPKEVMASWDPLTLAVAGFSLLHPFHSVPVYLESTDRLWADDVHRLASAAELVVIDTSHRSPCLSQEMDILSHSELSEKTIRFEELPERGVKEAGSDGGQEDIIFIEKGRFRRRASQAAGFIFTYVGFVLLSARIAAGLDYLSYLQDVNSRSFISSLIKWSSLVYSVVPAVWVASALSPEAGFTRRSSAELVRAMREKPRPGLAQRAERLAKESQGAGSGKRGRASRV
jgi:hypothetical protein